VSTDTQDQAAGNFRPLMWLNPDGTVGTNIPAGMHLVNEYEVRDGKPFLVRQFLAPSTDAQS
jgi:hypothetical protein